MPTAINLAGQEYFLKLAPDLSVIEMAEKYFYDNDLSEGVFNGVFLYKSNASTSYATTLHRAVFKVYTEGNITISGLSSDEYCVIPYTDGVQIVLAASESAVTLLCTQDMDIVVGVAF
jgi:hypothetical protein